MRVAVSKSDPGYVVDPQNYRVFLDGTEQRDCVMADEEKGEVERWQRNPDTDDLIYLAGGDYLTETVKGNVRIERIKT